tara:strand:- start:11766 stop:11924 length:159 start_codon:yes stop_codon:yes gene_type:complete
MQEEMPYFMANGKPLSHGGICVIYLYLENSAIVLFDKARDVWIECHAVNVNT